MLSPLNALSEGRVMDLWLHHIPACGHLYSVLLDELALQKCVTPHDSLPAWTLFYSQHHHLSPNDTCGTPDLKKHLTLFQSDLFICFLLEIGQSNAVSALDDTLCNCTNGLERKAR
jgi:hypothetical protein